MSVENTLTSCPRCNCTLNDTVNRLVKEFCGHLKCRACLLKENNGCELCYKLKVDDELIGTDAIIAPLEDHNIVYQITTSSVVSEYAESSSDKLQIDTDSELSNDFNFKTKTLEKTQKLNIKKKKGKTRRNKSLYSHILTKSNNDGKFFECSICKKTFTSRGHRHYHLFCNNVDKPLKCELCSKEFITKFHFNYHLETHQKNTTYKCHKCDRFYLRSNSLRKHLQKHSVDLKQFVCSDCGARFQNSTLLKSHENKHKNIYPFNCDQCTRKFTLKSNFESHLVVHLKEKKFGCDLCGKKFARKGALKLHSSSHSDERPYKCNDCNKTFTHQRIYTRHLAIHSGNKVFNCPFCEAKCSRKDNFYRHLRNLHPNSSYKENDTSIDLNCAIINNSDKIEKYKALNTSSEALQEDIPQNPDNGIIHDTKIKAQRNTRILTNNSFSDGPNSVNVIQSIGNVSPIKIPPFLNSIENENKEQELPTTSLSEYRSEIAKQICQITNQINSAPIKRITNANKPKKPYDPIEIYRKILMPNEHDEDDEEKLSNINENTCNPINQKEQDICPEIFQKPPPIDFSEVHWRKRTSQYFVMK